MFEDSTHGGRQRNRAGCVGTHHFNSRPHGGRRFFKREINARFQFQLTPSRRATYARFITLSMSAISTHALTEGDVSGNVLDPSMITFQLTPSRRATSPSYHLHSSQTFQLTPSRRATGSTTPQYPVWNISTHALTEGDQNIVFLFLFTRHFNSRPHGGRQCYQHELLS